MNDDTIESLRAERDAALATCAEMRAALEALLPIAFPVEGGSDGCGTVGGWKANALHQVRTALARTDLGRGMVAVPRELVDAVKDCAHCGPRNGTCRGCTGKDDLDALLKKGGG